MTLTDSDPTTLGWGPEVAAGMLAAGVTPKRIRTAIQAGERPDTIFTEDDALTSRYSPLDLGNRWAVLLGTPEYPTQLANIPAPPPILFGIGNPDALRAGIAVVGTRTMTALGANAAAVAADTAFDLGTPVHSGAADGVDTAAHEAALANGGPHPTVAVLASDVHGPMPAHRRALCDRIIDAGGAIVSEQPPGTEGTPPRLVARNRIQVGLSTVVVVCEASMNSGTMHTARFAIISGRSLIVPKPKGSYTTAPGASGLLALGNPDGMPANALGWTGTDITEACKTRRPLADGVAEGRDGLRDMIAAAHRFATTT